MNLSKKIVRIILISIGCVILGFIGAHLADKYFEHPGRVRYTYADCRARYPNAVSGYCDDTAVKVTGWPSPSTTISYNGEILRHHASCAFSTEKFCDSSPKITNGRGQQFYYNVLLITLIIGSMVVGIYLMISTAKRFITR